MAKSIQPRSCTYNLVEFLGEGLNSCVYRAFKETAGLSVRFEVALKILKSEKLVELWRNEFETLKRVQSPYCVGLLGWEIIGEQPALVLEYVNGVTLEELKNLGLLNLHAIDEIMQQAQQGLADLQAGGFFHGDLNLSNIMVNQTGGVKLVDFGILADKELYTTPKYAAPEVLRGERPNLATDNFSLNAICAELERSCSNNSDALKDLVKKAVVLKEKRRVSTQQMKPAGSGGRSSSARALLASLFCLFTIFCFGDQIRTDPAPPTHLSIRSSTWMKIVINGKSVGYAPVDVRVEGEKPLLIEWQSLERSGRSSLTPLSGEHIVLDDGFFASDHFRYRSGDNGVPADFK